jgi:hypothetical protein
VNIVKPFLAVKHESNTDNYENEDDTFIASEAQAGTNIQLENVHRQ